MGETALFIQNDAELVRALINNKIDINIKNNYGQTALDSTIVAIKYLGIATYFPNRWNNLKQKKEIIQERMCSIAYKKYEQDYKKNKLAFKAINKPIPVGLPRLINLDDKLSFQSLTFKTIIAENNLEILYKQNLFETFEKMELEVDNEKIKKIEKKVNDKIKLIEKEKTIIQPSAKDLQEAGPSFRLTQAEIEIEANKEEKVSQLSEAIPVKNKKKKSILRKITRCCVDPNLTDKQEESRILALENFQKENAKIYIANTDEIAKEAAKKAETKKLDAECLKQLKNNNLVAENRRETKIDLYNSTQKEKKAQDNTSKNRPECNVHVAEIKSKKSYSSFFKR